MRSAVAKWLASAAGLALLVALYFVVNWYRYRFIRSDDDLLKLLPNTQATVFFAEVSVLRQHGYLKLLSDAKAGQEKEYSRFVRETGFDFSKDLNALAGTAKEGRFRLALRGHFDWTRLREYVSANGGSCTGGLCRVATSTAHRALSIRMVQPDVMALAIGGDANGAERIRPGQSRMTAASDAPLWVRPAHALLTNPADLPLAARIFAISLQSADSVVLSIEPSHANGAPLAITIDALFTNRPAAETARDQLERSTQMLKSEFARDHKSPGPDELG